MFKNALYLCSIKGIGFLMLLVEVVNETKIALLLIKLVGSPYLYSFSSIAVCNRTLSISMNCYSYLYWWEFVIYGTESY